MPTPCYGMEDVVSNEGRSTLSTIDAESTFSDVTLDIDAANDEDNPLYADPRKKQVVTTDTESTSTYAKASQEKPESEKLRNNLNYYIKKEQPTLLKATKEQYAEAYDVNDNPLNIVSGLLVSTPETQGMLDVIDENFFEGGRKNYPNLCPPQSCGDIFWDLVWGTVIVWCGLNLICYAMSPWAIDPTRLFLAGNVFPFAAQTVAAVYLSISMASYHTFLYIVAGYYTCVEIYKTYVQNGGCIDTHGFMTLEDDQHKTIRDFEPMLDALKDANIKDAKNLYIEHAKEWGMEGFEYIQRNQNKVQFQAPDAVIKFLMSQDENITPEMLKNFKHAVRGIIIIKAKAEAEHRPHIASMPHYFGQSSLFRYIITITSSYIENFILNNIYDKYEWKLLNKIPDVPTQKEKRDAINQFEGYIKSTKDRLEKTRTEVLKEKKISDLDNELEINKLFVERSKKLKEREDKFHEILGEEIHAGEIGLILMDDNIYCKPYGKALHVLAPKDNGYKASKIEKYRVHNSSQLLCDQVCFNNLSTILQNNNKLSDSDKEELRSILKMEKWGIHVGNFITDAVERVGREIIFSSAPLLLGLLYSLTFFDAELNNGQMEYGYWFMLPPIYFFFKTQRESAEKWYRWNNHDKMNRDNVNVYNKKKTHKRAIRKNREFINMNTENSNNYVVTLYDPLTEKESLPETEPLLDVEMKAAKEKISKFSLLYTSEEFISPVSYEPDQQAAKNIRNFLAEEVDPTSTDESKPLISLAALREIGSLDRLASVDIEGMRKTATLPMLNLIKLSKSDVKSFLKTTASFAGVLWAIPEFRIYAYIADTALFTLYMDADIAYWTSMPIALLVTLFDLCRGGPKYYSKAYASVFDHLSWNRPLSFVKWALLPVTVSSALWSLSAYWGVLFDVLEGSDPILKWSMAVLTLNVLPEIVSWEYGVFDKLIRSRLMGYVINPIVDLAMLNPLKRLVNYCRPKTFKILSVCTKEIIYIDRHLERALELIHELDPKTTEEYSRVQMGMQ